MTRNERIMFWFKSIDFSTALPTTNHHVWSSIQGNSRIGTQPCNVWIPGNAPEELSDELVTTIRDSKILIQCFLCPCSATKQYHFHNIKTQSPRTVVRVWHMDCFSAFMFLDEYATCCTSLPWSWHSTFPTTKPLASCTRNGSIFKFYFSKFHTGCWTNALFTWLKDFL